MQEKPLVQPQLKGLGTAADQHQYLDLADSLDASPDASSHEPLSAADSQVEAPPDTESNTTPFSDIDLNRWKEYHEVLTGSLWLLGARDKSGPHVGDYWGNFVPQIARQVLLRFTRQGEAVVDLFSGMGTTLIECRHLGRHGIGIELSAEVAERSQERIARADNLHGITTVVLTGDAAAEDTVDQVRARLAGLGYSHAHCLILHPPYHDIIAFSADPRDLSQAPTLEAFLARFEVVVRHAVDLLSPGRFLALVIGDKYTRGEWVPLGFECMQVCRRAGLRLKAINIKDIQGNERGKGKNENLWKYRALVAGTYIFKHEYVMIFQKPGKQVAGRGGRLESEEQQ